MSDLANFYTLTIRLNEPKGLTADLEGNVPFTLEALMKLRLLQDFFETIAGTEYYKHIKHEPAFPNLPLNLVRPWSDHLKTFLFGILTPSAEHNLRRRNVDVFSCKKFKEISPESKFAYLWCKYHIVVDFVPFVNAIQQIIVFVEDTVSGRTVMGNELDDSQRILEAHIIALNIMPFVGTGKSIFSSFKAGT